MPDTSRDGRSEPAATEGTKRPAPLRLSATLIIVRERGGTLEVLMGRRHSRHRFMPSQHVFPGGRIEREDALVRTASPLDTLVEAQLRRRAPPARARAAASAAVRETFEETGLMLGGPDPDPGALVPESWTEFFATGQAPALDRLVYVARAITPPERPIRFDSRFFMVDAAHVTGELGGSGELLDLDWIGLSDTSALDLPMVTARAIREVATLWPRRAARDAGRPIPFFKLVGRTHIVVNE